MPDKLAELKQALEGMSLDGLKLIEEFAGHLKKYGQDKLQKRAGGQRQNPSQRR
ncbi:hypothetical protein ES703_116236 [subsurface metagenome]